MNTKQREPKDSGKTKVEGCPSLSSLHLRIPISGSWSHCGRGRPRSIRIAALGLLASLMSFCGVVAEPRSLSGIYPHLAMFNNEGECGTGAVVPWAGKLWVVTYAPHSPKGSSDKLYELSPALAQTVRPESIGGTPANRMIHRESQQLFIGPYAVDATGKVRVIAYTNMFGRPTGNARHLTDPAGKIYYATMEEGLYEVDVKSLAVKELWADEQVKSGRHAGLPGYHGKGLYSAFGRIIYANNGEHGAEAQRRPDVASGVLAEWDGRADAWSVVRRNQFTEVTGPGGIFGNAQPDRDPVWSIGWDHRSLILMCLARDGDTPVPGASAAGAADKSGRATWHSWRLPKASHSYDGAHGWNTEWPRIREIGEEDLLMTMHGMFWRFPKTFSLANSAGIAPRSTYLKVIGDFCRWNDRVVFGCDDTAKNEFLNKRKAKGEIAAPQSQSNLWFVEPARLDQLGPVIGRGAVWLTEDVAAAVPSDAFLFSGFARRAVHFTHATAEATTLTLEVDERGNGQWRKLREVALPARGTVWVDLSGEPRAPWIRVTSNRALTKATAWFSYSNEDPRAAQGDAMFAGLASAGEARLTGGIVRARGENKRTLHFTALEPGPDGPRDLGLYELDAELRLKRVEDATAANFQKARAAIPVGSVTVDAASVIFTDDGGRRRRLPKGDAAFDRASGIGPSRVCREVATERDLFNAHGTFFELPAENAGGFAKVRAVATHNRRVVDFCSYRGLMVMSGIATDAPTNNPHLLRSDDGKTALWAGAIDDVWKLGKPRGSGGPWRDTAVKAGAPSEPFLMTGYDRKRLTLAHTSSAPVTMRVEVDLAGTGLWVPYREFTVVPGKATEHMFPAAFTAYWARVTADKDATATVIFDYD